MSADKGSAFKISDSDLSRLTEIVNEWCKTDPDPDSVKTLQNYLTLKNTAALFKSFNGLLEFGTAGLRGPLIPGPSGMNLAVVQRAAAAICTFMKDRSLKSVVIGMDARHGSAEFAKLSAQIFAGSGFQTWIFPDVCPTPLLAFAVNYLAADVGIMVTASHNPAIDNGYKVYLGKNVDGIRFHGSQIISPIDKEIATAMQNVSFPIAKSDNYLTLNNSVEMAYLNATTKLVTLKTSESLNLVYTPLHGVGGQTFLNTLSIAGFKNVSVVKEQMQPDADFPTVPFPNPEEKGAIDLALKLAQQVSADLVIAHDPDADRCAIATNFDGKWQMWRGDEVGAILGRYLQRKFNFKKSAYANSLVSGTLLGKIAKKNFINYSQTLTGFKWVSKVSNLVYGYEEALGYCVDPIHVNDKDGISAGLMLAELALECKTRGITLREYLTQIYRKYGWHLTNQISLRFENIETAKIKMKDFENNHPKTIGNEKLKSFTDLSTGYNKLPSTDGFILFYGKKEQIRVIVRPSGTEPKMKCYIEVIDKSEKKAIEMMKIALSELTRVLS